MVGLGGVCPITSLRSFCEVLKLHYGKVLTKMEHRGGDRGDPSTVVSDQSRARAPSLLLQLPAQSLARSEHSVSVVECMNHLLEAFQR